MNKFFALLAFLLITYTVRAEDGYDLWLRYKQVSNPALLASYKQRITEIQVSGNSATIEVVKEELTRALQGLLNAKVPFTTASKKSGALIIGTPASSSLISSLGFANNLKEV